MFRLDFYSGVNRISNLNIAKLILNSANLRQLHACGSEHLGCIRECTHMIKEANKSKDHRVRPAENDFWMSVDGNSLVLLFRDL